MKRDWLRYSFVFLAFLGVFSTYPKVASQPIVVRANPSNIVNISTAQDFQNINQNLAGHYLIVNDIDFLNFPFVPLATNSNFTGTIDGGGFTLRNLTITSPEIIQMELVALGIIINNNGTIRNLNVEDVKIQSDNGNTFQTDDLNETRVFNLSYFVVYNFANGVIEDVALSLKSHTLIFQVTTATNAYALELSIAFIVFDNRGLIHDTSVLLDEDLSFDVQGGQRRLDLIVASIIRNSGTIDSFTFRMIPSNSPQPSVNALEILNAEAGTLISTINIALIAYENLGTIRKTYAIQLGKITIDSHYQSSIVASYFTILNKGIIDEAYLNIEGDLLISSSLGFSTDEVEVMISYYAYINFNIGQISNVYSVIRGIIDYRMTRATNHQLSWSGLVYENLGRIISFYNVGEVKIRLDVGTFNASPQSTFFISRLTVKDSESSVIRHGLTDLSIRMFMFTTSTTNVLKAQQAKNATTFYNTTTNVHAVNNKVDIISKYEDLFFGRRIADNASVFDDTIGNEKYAFDNTENYVIRNNGDFSPNFQSSDWFNSTRFSTMFWSFDQREFYSNGPVLKFLTLFPFELTNQTIYPEGFEYEVPQTFNVFMNGVQQASGTYYFTGYAVHEFILESILSGIRNKLTLIVVNDDINITDGGVYSGPITPKILGVTSLTLNGTPYQSGTEITDPGVYTLVIEGQNGYSQTISFRIDLIKDGVLNGSTGSSPVTPTFSGGTATLNGQPFSSGTPVMEVGIYELVITGVNNFVDTTTFTIAPVVTGLQNGTTYNASFTPNITGTGMTATLNGQVYALGTSINTPGSYTLVINGNGNYSQTFTFTIALTKAGFANDVTYNSPVTPTFSGGTATLNGQPFTSGTTITDVGIYELVITGVNPFVDTTTFTIAPVVTGLQNGLNYEGSVTPVITGSGITIELNGTPYQSGTEITDPGVYTLVIEGLNGYEARYTFTIVLQISNITNQAVYSDSVIPTFSGGTATLNGQPFSSGTTITDVGIYELEITGVNNFVSMTTFSIRPVITGLEENGNYNGLVNINILGNGMTVTLNGSPFENGILNEPGVHELVIEGQGGYRQVIPFTIQLIVSGVLAGERYINQSPIIRFTGGSATLNGVAISSEYSVTEVGHYRLLIERRNQEPYELSFSILPEIARLANERTYRGTITPTITGRGMTLTLNGQPYVSGTAITNPGLNYMRITTPNGNYEQMITFTITLVVTGFDINETHYDVVRPVFSGGIATLNNESFVSNTAIRTFGNFQLIVRGVNDFESVMNFSIAPYLMTVPQDNSSASEIDLALQERHPLTIITLNGEPFSESRMIKEVGIYDLLITYDEKVIVDIQFVVEPQNYLLDGTVLNTPVIIDYPFSETRINGTLVEGPYRIDLQGDYTIEVQGVNGYVHRYSIEFVNNNRTYVNQLLIPLAALTLSSLVIYFIRRWRVR